jgi:hypothetical protein
VSPINLRDPHIRARVYSALAEHPHLPEAIKKISHAAGLPEDLVSSRLEEAVLGTLEVLGDSYVSEMGAALVRVQRLRSVVHGFYERAFARQLARGDASGLRAALERLRDATRELAAPEVWAKRRAGGHHPASDPMAAAMDLDLDPRPGGGVEARRPGDPHAPARWQVLRDERRVAGLPERLREPFRKARELAPEETEAALWGDAGARQALRAALRDRLRRSELSAALDAVDAIRAPDLSYALGGGTTGGGRLSGVQRAYPDLPARQRDAVERAAAADPEFVRSMVSAEIGYGPRRSSQTPWRPEEMDRFCAEHDISGQRRADLEAALRELNREHRAGLRAAADDAADTPKGEERDAVLDELAENLGLPPQGRIVAELARSRLLREIAADSPGQLLDIASTWLEASAKRIAKGKRPTSLRSYLMVLMTSHVRGLVGELGAVFQLGKDFWVLKAPDILVTEPGTDFVVVAKATGELWFCDNKALSDSGLSSVTSLVENLGKNLEDDVAAFDQILRRNPRQLPPAVADAIARARAAASRVNDIVEGMPSEEIRSPHTQKLVNEILEPLGIRRVITNVGGELTELSDRLRRFHLDLADLESAISSYPERRLRGYRPRRQSGKRKGMP